MTQQIDQTPGGLYVVTTMQPTPPPLPEPSGLKCANCDCRSVETVIPPLGWRTRDGWPIGWPTCGCGKYVRCPDCEGKHTHCPFCGCQEEYT